MISKIDSFESANEHIVSRLSQNNNLFLPLDKYTHHALTNDQFEILRSATSIEYDEFVRNYLDLVNDVHDISTYAFTGYSITKAESKQYIVYPFSKTHLYNSIYSDVLPSIFSVYFNLLKQNDRIRQFGTGVGKAFIINTAPLTKQDFASLKSMTYKDTVDLMVIVSEQIAKQNTDVEYLLQKIVKLTEENQFFLSEIERLNQLVINTSINTWR